MIQYTITQAVLMSLAYFFITILLPGFVLYGRISRLRFAQRILIYFVSGNFFVINLVYLLELLHISYPFTLTLFTAFFVAYMRKLLYHHDWKKWLLSLIDRLHRLANGTLKLHTEVVRIKDHCFSGMKKGFRHIGSLFLHHILDWILVAFVIISVCYYYGNCLIHVYGYTASDLIVHNYWINELSNNNVFAAGIYPFGFHNTLYYLHAVFGFETFNLLREFYLVQDMWIALIFVLCARLLCKTRFVYAAPILFFLCSDLFSYSTYYRYYMTLPQEFGMIMILPSVYYAIAFFQRRKKEIQTGNYIYHAKKHSLPHFHKLSLRELNLKRMVKGWYDSLAHRIISFHESQWALVLFIMSFSLTITIHFYDTFIAAFFCIGVVLGFAHCFFQKSYLRSVLKAIKWTLVVAIAPMLIAFLFGKPLQGSLGWGLNIIRGTSAIEAHTNILYADLSENRSFISLAALVPSPLKQSFQAEISQLYMLIRSYVWGLFPGQNQIYPDCVLFGIGVLLLLGGFYQLFQKERMYGSTVMSFGIGMVLLTLLLSAYGLGLPRLIDYARTSIFYVYTGLFSSCILLDAILNVFSFIDRKAILRTGMSIAVSAYSIHWMLIDSGIRPAISDDNQIYESEKTHVPGYELNGAMKCFVDIMQTETDYQWTIISANDELQMGIDHGWHYESIDLLEDLEDDSKEIVTIPTKTIYVFIEKRADYAYCSLNEEDRWISASAAAQPLPENHSLNAYKSQNRVIVMSKMYYWMQAFQSLYPNDIVNWYEDDTFVCYKINQNVYRLFDCKIQYEKEIENAIAESENER